MSANSGLNAIARAVEALYVRDRNPVSSLMAVEGVRAFKEALLKIAVRPDDRSARSSALYGSWLCGTVLGRGNRIQKIEHLGLMFGALAASPSGIVKGRGVPLSQLTFGLLVFPRVWDWYLQWREQRRGFYTKWEVDMLMVAQALTRADVGWIRQHPKLLKNVRPIDGPKLRYRSRWQVLGK